MSDLKDGRAFAPAPLDRASRVYVAGHRGLVGSAIVRKLEAEGFTDVVDTRCIGRVRRPTFVRQRWLLVFREGLFDKEPVGSNGNAVSVVQPNASADAANIQYL